MPRKGSMDTGELTDPAFFILLSLMEEKHGYLIMKSIEDRTDQEVTIGPASLYTTLKKLLDADLIQLVSETSDNKKVYITTEEGLNVLERDFQRRKRMLGFAEKMLEGRSVR